MHAATPTIPASHQKLEIAVNPIVGINIRITGRSKQ
jgi:hypothetical protein